MVRKGKKLNKNVTQASFSISSLINSDNDQRNCAWVRKCVTCDPLSYIQSRWSTPYWFLYQICTFIRTAHFSHPIFSLSSIHVFSCNKWNYCFSLTTFLLYSIFSCGSLAEKSAVWIDANGRYRSHVCPCSQKIQYCNKN